MSDKPVAGAPCVEPVSAGSVTRDAVARESMASVTLNGRAVDRRTFLGAAGLGAGALLMAQFVPIAPAKALPAPVVGSATGMIGEAEANGAWHVDDMWGHWPRYAHPIPYSPAQAMPVSWDHIHPADLQFL